MKNKLKTTGRTIRKLHRLARELEALNDVQVNFYVTRDWLDPRKKTSFLKRFRPGRKLPGGNLAAPEERRSRRHSPIFMKYGRLSNTGAKKQNSFRAASRLRK